MKKTLILLIPAALLSSCAAFTDGYSRLTKEQRNSIVPFNKNLPLSRDYVYKVNASELLETIKDYPKAFVYVFTPGCTSDACFPLTVYENFAKKNGYKVFFVLSGYGSLDYAFEDPIKEPLFVINSDYYGKKFLHGYIRPFENELKGRDKKDKSGDLEGSLHFYENGVYKDTYIYLPRS